MPMTRMVFFGSGFFEIELEVLQSGWIQVGIRHNSQWNELAPQPVEALCAIAEGVPVLFLGPMAVAFTRRGANIVGELIDRGERREASMAESRYASTVHWIEQALGTRDLCEGS